jgi:hypothetical protein
MRLGTGRAFFHSDPAREGDLHIIAEKHNGVSETPVS